MSAVSSSPTEFIDLEPAAFVEAALRRGEGTLTDTGALLVTTGESQLAMAVRLLRDVCDAVFVLTILSPTDRLPHMVRSRSATTS